MEKALFECMFSTGCPIREIVVLERNDSNLGSNATIVRGKGDKKREAINVLLISLS